MSIAHTWACAFVATMLGAASPGLALDRATAMIDVRDAWAREPSLGRGVVVGVVDSGIDPTHADFVDARGHTRIAYVLEIGETRRGLHRELEAIGAGAVWSADDIDEARLTGAALPRDVLGHATAVAAAAVGDGGDTDTPGALAGVAPNATLVAVRALRPGMSRIAADDVLIGARFVFEVATRLSMPAVVVIPSASPRDEPTRDGTPLSVALESLAGLAAGRVVVAAAGNLGNADHHQSLELGDGRTAVELSLPATDDAGLSGVDVLLRLSPTLDGRFSTPDLSLVSPAGAVFAMGALAVGPPAALDPTRDCAVYEPIDCLPDGRAPDVIHELESGRARLFHPAGADPDGARWWTLSLVGGGELPPLAHGRYGLTFGAGEGRLDVVIIRAERKGAWRTPFLVEGRDGRPETSLVGYPGAAAGIVSVGAVTSREASAIATFMATDEAILPPRRAAFSSAGPTFDARPEPDLVAPGRYVATALAAGSRYATDPTYATYRQGDRIALAGTSLAAPLVAGALALVLARHPSLSSDALVALARSGARPVSPARDAYDVELGAGVLSAAALIDAADVLVARRSELAVPSESSVAVTATRVGPSGSITRVVVRPRDANGRPTHGSAFARATHGRIEQHAADPTGAIVFALHLGDVVVEKRVRVDVTLDGASMPPVYVEVERDAARVRGGGCAVGSAGARPRLGAIVLLLLVAARRGRPGVARGAFDARRGSACPKATSSPRRSV